MNKFSKYTSFCVLHIACCLFLTSCYEDKGNYIYDESIQEVNVVLNASYGVKKENNKFSFTITPEILVSDDYKKNLTYEWYVGSQSVSQQGELTCTDECLTMELDPTQGALPSTYYVRFYVTDKLTGAVTMQPTQIEIVPPYTYAWMVMHEQDGHAALGSVEYMGGEMLVTPDAYARETGKTLTGKPLGLHFQQCEPYASIWKFGGQSVLYITTDNPEESGMVNTTNKFEMRGRWTDLLHPAQREEYFNPENIVFSGGNYGSLMVSKGKVFMHSTYSPCFYLMSQGSDVDGECYISKLGAGPQAGVGFDEVGHRFLNLSMQNYDYFFDLTYSATPYSMGPVTQIPRNEANAYDPSKIPADQKIVAIVPGYHYAKSGIAPWQRYTLYGYTISGGQSHVYVFQCRGLTSSDPALPYYFTFPTPDGITENTPMVSGASFNNILFYAVGNKVYKLDVSNGNSQLIYQHDDSNAKVADLRMALSDAYAWSDSSDEVGADDYGVPYCRCLGVAYNCSDGKGELVVLHLNTNGRVMEENAKYPSTQVHKGFGPIKNIAFI